MRLKVTINILLFSSFLLGCGPASSPQIDPVSKANSTLMSSTQSATSISQSAQSWWHPTLGLTWQWQIGNNDVDTSIEADVYDIDLYVDQSVIDELHAKGRKVICYINVGSWEDWRPDKDKFPPEVLGRDYEGWPGERWLDIRQMDKLAPIMRARLDVCKAKGFDAVEPDNMEVHTNNTGFPLTYEDQLTYALWLADEAHARGLSVGLKNDPDQVADLLPYFDWALTEDCFAEAWCQEMVPFIQMGKPVLAAEYTDNGVTTGQVCPEAKRLRFSLILKDRELGAWRQPCP